MFISVEYDVCRNKITAGLPMLMRFEVENYRGFRDRVVLDLTTVRNYGFNQHCIRDGLINKALIVGVNGCGKTNLGLALFDIVGTLTDKGLDMFQRDQLCFLNGDGDLPYASFVYLFRHGGSEIRYEYRKTDPSNIVYERMDVDGGTVFVRDGMAGSSDYAGLAGMGAENLTMDLGNGRLSVLRYVANNTVQGPDSPVRFVMRFAEHMLYFRSVQEGNSYIGLTKGMEAIETYIMDNGLVGDFQRFLKDNADVDMSLEGMKVDGMSDMFVQRTRNRALPFGRVASSGTKALLLFYYWMRHFDDVSFLYMDEFDAYYHNELAERVMDLVAGDARFQAVLTSHNTSLVSNSILRPDCYLRMGADGVRSFADLTDRELREGHNLEKLYRGGEFDARA